MRKMALLVVDVQNLLVEENPYDLEMFTKRLKTLISTARENQVEVIYVRHDDGEGDLVQGAPAWEIHESVAPIGNEYIVDKHYNSAFHKTELDAYLKERCIDTLVLAGMQTEYCIDATLKSAFDLEYQMIVAKGCNTTFSNQFLDGKSLFEFYNYAIWENRFAKLLNIDEIAKLMKEFSENR